MQRNRKEAEEIVDRKYPQIQGHERLILITHYQRTNEWACKNCDGVGSIIKIDSSLKIMKTVDCLCKVIRKKKLISDELRSKSNIPKKYHTADLKNWNNPASTQQELEVNQNSITIIEKYCNQIVKLIEKGCGLFLTGPNGVGKTFIACSIANRAMNAGKSVKYYTMSEIIQTEIRGWKDEDSAIISRGIKKSDLLILDDLDKVYRTKTGIEQMLFDNLLRCRLQSNKSCIFTSNRTMKDSYGDHGSHIASMLFENSVELVIVGRDYRMNISSKLKEDIINDS